METWTVICFSLAVIFFFVSAGLFVCLCRKAAAATIIADDYVREKRKRESLEKTIELNQELFGKLIEKLGIKRKLKKSEDCHPMQEITACYEHIWVDKEGEIIIRGRYLTWLQLFKHYVGVSLKPNEEIGQELA